MLLTLTTTHEPATDLGFLLHKKPTMRILAVPERKGVQDIGNSPSGPFYRGEERKP